MTFITTSMTTIFCYKCGIAFCMTDDLYKRRDRDHENFWCPNGHSQVFVGKTEEQKLKEKLRRSELELEQVEKNLKDQKKYTKVVEHQRAAMKGQNTKIKNRVSKGVCPCCNRQFKNLHAHMTTQHPDYTETK